MILKAVVDVPRPTLCIFLSISLLLVATSAFAGESAEHDTQSSAEIRTMFEVVCTQCHGLKPIIIIRDGELGWKNMVQEMVLRGAQLNPEEADAITQYLVQNYGPGVNPAKTGFAPPNAIAKESDDGMLSKDISLPAGQGKELVEGRCKLCHDLGLVVSVRRAADEWDRITRDMISRGIPASPHEISDIVSYLATHFGEEN